MKTAVVACGLVLAVNGGVVGDAAYIEGGDYQPPSGPAPVPVAPADPPKYSSPAVPDPTPVTPPTDNKYGQGTVPDNKDDDSDDDKYADGSVPPVVIDTTVDPPKATDPDYEAPAPDYKPPAPVDPYPTDVPAPGPSPVIPDDKPVYKPYDPPSQEKCGALYVDVLEHYFHYILSHIDASVVDAIIKLLEQLLQYVQQLDQSDDAVNKVVEQVKTVADYATNNLLDEDTKKVVVDVVSKAQQTYGSIYDTTVDADMYQAWQSLWEPCHPATDPSAKPDPKYTDTVKAYYDSFSSYMEDGASNPVYQEQIQKLCDHPDPAVSDPAKKVQATAMQLQSEADAAEQVTDATDSAGKVAATVGFLASALAVLF